MKNYIYVLVLLVFCFSCKSKDISAIEKAEVISLAGTSWVEKGQISALPEVYFENKIKFKDKKNATITYWNTTRTPASYPLTYKQDGLKVTLYHSGIGPIYEIKIKSDNVLELVSLDYPNAVYLYTRATSEK